jgi:hypothetical protein
MFKFLERFIVLAATVIAFIVLVICIADYVYESKIDIIQYELHRAYEIELEIRKEELKRRYGIQDGWELDPSHFAPEKLNV